MTNETLRKYLHDQVHEIELQKWLESEKAGHDLGEDFVKEWVKTNSKAYREKWEREHNA